MNYFGNCELIIAIFEISLIKSILIDYWNYLSNVKFGHRHVYMYIVVQKLCKVQVHSNFNQTIIVLGGKLTYQSRE